MKISVIVPVGDNNAWTGCKASIERSLSEYRGEVEAEVLPCFDLEHRGAYIARNEGLERATGEWIAWVDCDDVVEPCWFAMIAEAVTHHSDADIIQFDALEVKSGKIRPLKYKYKGVVEGGVFARELLRNDGMPAWLWTRVFRRELFDGLQFEGRVKQDYEMFLKLLPRVKNVLSLGRPLYRYIRHGYGLSNYVQSMDYAEAGRGFEAHILRLPVEWQNDACIGLALTMADVAVHSKECNGASSWVRKYLWQVLSDHKVPFRLKVKCLIAASKK